MDANAKIGSRKRGEGSNPSLGNSVELNDARFTNLAPAWVLLTTESSQNLNHTLVSDKLVREIHQLAKQA